MLQQPVSAPFHYVSFDLVPTKSDQLHPWWPVNAHIYIGAQWLISGPKVLSLTREEKRPIFAAKHHMSISAFRFWRIGCWCNYRYITWPQLYFYISISQVDGWEPVHLRALSGSATIMIRRSVYHQAYDFWLP